MIPETIPALPFRRSFEVKKDGCYGCPIQCKKSTTAGEHVPNMSPVSHLSEHFNKISDSHQLSDQIPCRNELGMDTICRSRHLVSLGGSKERIFRMLEKYQYFCPILPTGLVKVIFLPRDQVDMQDLSEDPILSMSRKIS